MEGEAPLDADYINLRALRYKEIAEVLVIKA